MINHHIVSLNRDKRNRHGHCPIPRMSVNRVSTTSGFESLVIYVLIGCSHPLMRYWPPLGAKSTAAHSLLYPENEHQCSVNNCWSCRFGNQGIVWLFEHITQQLTALIYSSRSNQRKTTESKTIDIANCKSFTNTSSAIEDTILIRHDYQSAKTIAIYECIDGPAGWPADYPLNSDSLGDLHRTVPDSMVSVYWQPWQPDLRWFGFNPDPAPMWWSRTVANTRRDWSSISSQAIPGSKSWSLPTQTLALSHHLTLWDADLRGVSHMTTPAVVLAWMHKLCLIL